MFGHELIASWALGTHHAFTSCMVLPSYAQRTQIDLQVETHAAFNPSRKVVHFRYTLTSKPDSHQAVWAFAIKQDAPILNSGSPLGWSGDRFVDKPFWLWGSDEAQYRLKPGTEASRFFLESKGLPGIQPYFAQGHAPPLRMEDIPSGTSTQEIEAAIDFFSNSIRGMTVGPTSTTTDAPPSVIISFLIDQKHSTASLGWIRNQGITRTLDQKLEAAQKSLGKGQVKTARNQLQAFQQEVRAQAGNHLTSDAAAILDTGAEVAIRAL